MTLRRSFTCIFVLIIFALFFPQKSLAASNSHDLSVVCFGTNEIDDCSISPSNATLFHETGVLPGDSFTQFLDVTNSTQQAVSPAWKITSPIIQSSIAEVIEIEVRSESANGTIVMPAQLLSDLQSNQQFITLLPLNAQATARYAVIATVQTTAGNQYQGSQTTFDVAVNVQLQSTTSSPTPTSTSNSNSNTNSNSQALGTSTTNSGASPTQCTAAVPSSAPVASVAGPINANGEVVLGWTAVNPVTTYAINFGVQPGIYLYGNASVGNVTSYTVGGLTPNTQYYFQVIPINDCAPGPRSNEVVTPGQLVAPETTPPPENFSPGDVLGEIIENSPSPTPISAVLPFVLGSEIQTEQAYCQEQWWLPLSLLFFQFIGQGTSYFFLRKMVQKLHLTVQPLLVIASVYLFYTAYQCDTQTWLSNWYWLISIGLGGLLIVLLKSFSFFQQKDSLITKDTG